MKKYLDFEGLAYFWTKIKSMFASSGRSGTDIIPADRALGIPSGQVDSTSTSTEFTATIEGITELRDGICVYLTNDVVSSASEFTININGLGAKPVYLQQTGAQSVDLFSKSSTYLFIYNSQRIEGGCWDSYNAVAADKFYNGVTTAFIRSRETGEGEITRLQGNTVVWNQLLPTNSLGSVSNWAYSYGGASLTPINNNEAILKRINTNSMCTLRGKSNDLDISHLYYLSVTAKKIAGSEVPLYLGFLTLLNTIGNNDTVETVSTDWETLNLLTRPVRASDRFGIRIGVTGSPADVEYHIKNVCLIDVTAIYGEGNEPATVEEFDDWLEKNIGLRDYYDYNEGEIISVKSTAFKTTGFNLFNLATNKAHVIKGQQVQITGSYTKVLDGEGEVTLGSDGLYVPSTEYITIEGADSTTCVHFAGRNDEYEPYWENIAPLNITTIKGKSNRVAVFPDGMKRVRNVYDEIKVENGVTKAVKRVGSVDLGTLTWTYRSNFGGMSAALKPKAKNSFYAICSAYPFRGVYSDLSDKQCGYIYNNQIFVKDNDYTDADTFKAAMQGVLLYYELATPRGYILDNFELPVDFKEDAWGVSEMLPNSEASPTSLAPVTDLRYLSRMSVLEKKSKGPITASSFIKSGGTASQFLKADGSVDDTAYAPLNSPALTGTPTAPTAEANSNNNQVATTAFVKSVIPQTVVLPQFNEKHFGITNDKVTLVNDKGDYVEYVVTRSDPEGAVAHANSEQLIPSLDYIEYLMEQTGMGLTTFTQAKTSVSLGLEVCTILSVPVDDLSVSLPIASEGLSTTSKLYVTASDQPAISFTSEQTIKYTKDYVDNPIDSGREYEITAFWNGQFWLISKQEIAVN